MHWVQQQHEKVRKKRDYNTDYYTQQFGELGGYLRDVAPSSRVHYRDAGPHNIFPDPLFKEQWYLVSSVCVHRVSFVRSLLVC